MNPIERKHKEELIGSALVGAALKVHKTLGPGLLERIYEACLAYELEQAGLKVDRQIFLPVVYDDMKFDEGYRVDLLIEDLVLVELKSAEIAHPVWSSQVLTYLRLSELKLGYLINFNVGLIKDGIHRYRIWK